MNADMHVEDVITGRFWGKKGRQCRAKKAKQILIQYRRQPDPLWKTPPEAHQRLASMQNCRALAFVNANIVFGSRVQAIRNWAEKIEKSGK